MRGSKREIRKGVWELRVSIGKDPTTGKYRTISQTCHGGARAADDALRDLVDRQVPIRSDGLKVTVSQLLNRWLEECERLDLSPTTMRTYRAQIEQTIRPALGKVQLTRLTARDLDSLYGALKDRGLSPKTIRNHHAILSAALHQAARWGWVRENVADRAKPPHISQRRVKAPSVEMVRAIVEAAEDRDPRLAPMLMLGALTGLRRGELCALRWTDARLDVGELNVSRSVVVVPRGLAEKSTKTDRDRRVALDEVAILVLKMHRANVDEWARQAETTAPDDAFVFSPYVDGSKPFRPDNVTGFFTRVRDSLGMPEVRLYDLRHFTATQLIGANVDIRTVAG
ncbi:MAG: tyrosine-type recombinase/integrase, partial [Acidimicrobiales bacterium]